MKDEQLGWVTKRCEGLKFVVNDNDFGIGANDRMFGVEYWESIVVLVWI